MGPAKVNPPQMLDAFIGHTKTNFSRKATFSDLCLDCQKSSPSLQNTTVETLRFLLQHTEASTSLPFAEITSLSACPRTILNMKPKSNKGLVEDQGVFPGGPEVYILLPQLHWQRNNINLILQMLGPSQLQPTYKILQHSHKKCKLI